MDRQVDYNFPKTGIHRHVVEYIRNMPDLQGKTVLDIPCGDGRTSYELKKKGANLVALDLFPDFIKLDNVSAEYADLGETLPIDSDSVDYIICQEGIEHIPNQLNALQEFNRVLKNGGTLIITTPNNSHVRARVSHFLLETDLWKRMPPTEIDGVWFAGNEESKLYFGHLFLLGVQHFQSLITFSGFKVNRRIKTDLSGSSLIMGIATYPLFLTFTIFSYFSYRKKNPHIEKNKKRRILWSRVKLNLSPLTLFHKHIFWEVRKTKDLDKISAELKLMQRN